MTLVAVIGSVTPPGRLRGAIEFALAQAQGISPDVETELVDLANFQVSFADGRPLDAYGDDTARVVSKLEASDALILATPVYRATFTGALKNLLDLTPLEALIGKPVGIVAMGATLHHYLGADWQLRSVLSWFGAMALPTSVYLESSHFKDGELTDERAQRALMELVEGLVKARTLRGLGPPPLSAGRG